MLVAAVSVGSDILAAFWREGLWVGERIAVVKEMEESNEDVETTQFRRWLT